MRALGSLATFTIVGVFLCLTISVSHAQVRSSTNFQIQSDSLNVGGGFSSSTNFTQESTVGEAATGRSDSASFSLRAGYQQMQEIFLALTAPANVVMDPSLGGVTGGVANGTTSVNALTDNGAGYQLTIEAGETPAMRSGANTIADYVPEGGVPDFNFIVDTTEAVFGFSPVGSDVVGRFLDNGAVCGVGSGNTDRSCWDGLSTTRQVIAESSSANQPAGATTTVQLRVGVGALVNQPAGSYVATTTITLLPL